MLPLKTLGKTLIFELYTILFETRPIHTFVLFKKLPVNNVLLWFANCKIFIHFETFLFIIFCSLKYSLQLKNNNFIFETLPVFIIYSLKHPLFIMLFPLKCSLLSLFYFEMYVIKSLYLLKYPLYQYIVFLFLFPAKLKII